jgi:hypothetical protein
MRRELSFDRGLIWHHLIFRHKFPPAHPENNPIHLRCRIASPNRKNRDPKGLKDPTERRPDFRGDFMQMGACGVIILPIRKIA